MKKGLSIIFLLLVFQVARSQGRLSDHNTIGWFSATITPKINAKWSGHFEYQWRRNKLITDWQQSLMRVGVNYKLNPNVTFHIGYGWAETFPYGKYTIAAVARQFPEHRAYEQVVVNAPLGKVSLLHRLRLEQRWLGRLTSINSEKADDYIFLNRIRYMPRLDIPLNGKWYAAVYDEVFIGFGENIGENIFDQNRIGILAGFKPKSYFRIEGGFLSQTVQLGREITGQNVFQYNNGFIINSYFNL